MYYDGLGFQCEYILRKDQDSNKGGNGGKIILFMVKNSMNGSCPTLKYVRDNWRKQMRVRRLSC